MRAKRSKQYRKLMHQYALLFNFREPYQVLIDGEIVQAAARFKMRLGGLLENTLHGSIKPMITQCCIRHLYALPVNESDPGAKKQKEECIAVAKQAERRRCGHHELEEPLSALECLKSVVDPKDSGMNKHRYVVATQDQVVRSAMRAIAGVPLVYINRSVMILEPMADKTAEVRSREEKGKIRAGLKARPEASVKRKREDNGEKGEENEGEPAIKKAKKPKGPKGPNPLSVKKAKKERSKSTGVEEQERSALREMAGEEGGAEDVTNGVAVDLGTKQSADAPAKRKRKRQRGQKPDEGGQENVVDQYDQ